jgi:anaerobic magnesium-protoporphyrin IX monomethyl ester cyclase
LLASRSRKVVLFLPPYKGKILGPPLGLLSLAGALREAGYAPHIIDGAVDPNYRTEVAEQIEDCLCFGVSLLTGPMILDAIEISRMVKRIRPEIPVVFGGWHPSLLSGQTLREEFVDVVVRHQGDLTLVEILRRIEAGKPLDLVQGCWFKRGSQIIQNPDRPAAKLSSLPAPAYDLIDFDAYERASGERKLTYATSVGCPYACNYCTDMVFYNRRFNAYSAEHVVSELTDLVARYRLTGVSLLDSNFLVDIRRAEAIARGILDSGVRFQWTFQASTDFVRRMTDEQVQLLGASGVSHIGFGTESASDEILTRMDKHHQTVPQFDNTNFSPNLFTPYPGIPIWSKLREMGMLEPDTLAGWARIDLGANNLPWLQGASFRKLERSIRYFLLDNEIHRSQRKSGRPAFQLLLRLTRKSLHWRLKHAFFEFPLELWLSAARRRLMVRRSLLTGQPLSHELATTPGLWWRNSCLLFGKYTGSLRRFIVGEGEP